MKLLHTLVLTLLVSSAGAATESIESAIELSNTNWERAFNSGDSAALAELYSADAVLVSPSLEIFNAKHDIRQFWKEHRLTGTDNLRLQSINFRIQGDVIYQSAVWLATKTSNGIAAELDGEMTNVMTRQQDGSWKIQLQSWN